MNPIPQPREDQAARQRLHLPGLLVLLLLPAWAGATCPGEAQRALRSAARIESEWPLRPFHDPASQYLQRLGERLAGRDSAAQGWAALRHWPRDGWRLFIVRELSVNAFSIGNGRIYITEGTFHFAETEGQLAAIVAHEIAHQLAGHFCEEKETAANGRRIGSLVQVLDMHKELEADLRALDILARAGFLPEAMLEVVRTLPFAGDRQPSAIREWELTLRLPPVGSRPAPPDSEAFIQIKELFKGAE